MAELHDALSLLAPPSNLILGSWQARAHVADESLARWFEVLSLPHPSGRQLARRGLLRCFERATLDDHPHLSLLLDEEVWLGTRHRHPDLQALLDGPLRSPTHAGYVIEVSRGVALRRALSQVGPLPAAAALEAVRRLTDALRHLHGLNDDEGHPLLAVHRRLNLDTVWFSGGAAGQPAGVRCASSALDWPAGQHEGLDGLSPEAAEGRPLEARSDLHQVAHVLMALLLGRPPCLRATPIETVRATRDLDARPVDWEAVGAPPGLKALVAACLSRRPLDRPASASELAGLLAAAAARLGEDGAGALDTHVKRVLARCPPALCGLPAGVRPPGSTAEPGRAT